MLIIKQINILAEKIKWIAKIKKKISIKMIIIMIIMNFIKRNYLLFKLIKKIFKILNFSKNLR